MKVIEVNVLEETVIEREPTEEELKQLKKDVELDKAAQKAVVDRAAKRAALLEKLGITEEEAKVLLGQAM